MTCRANCLRENSPCHPLKQPEDTDLGSCKADRSTTPVRLWRVDFTVVHGFSDPQENGICLGWKIQGADPRLEKSRIRHEELPTTLEPGAMTFMMSKEAYLTDEDGHNLAHLMFYTPLIDRENWGAGLPKSPVILGQKGPPEPFNIFMVPVGKWSDGTPALYPDDY
jgi:hypothetical protein